MYVCPQNDLLAFNLLSTKSQPYRPPFRPYLLSRDTSRGVHSEHPEDVDIFSRVDSNPKSSMGREYLPSLFPPLNIAIFHLMFLAKETTHSAKIWE